MRRLLSATALLGLLATTANAGPLDTLTWQGRLLDPLGQPRNGSYPVTFRIYDDTGMPWFENESSVTFSDGYAHVVLGDGTPFPASLFDGDALELEIVVDNVVMAPRQPIDATAFAFTARDVRGGTVEASSLTADTATVADLTVTGTLTEGSGVVSPAGMITAYAGANAPAGWLFCNGATVSRTTYARLFAAIGTAYGAGDGSTTFRLPDLRGIFPRGAGTNAVISGNSTSLGAYQDDMLDDHTHYSGRSVVMYENGAQLNVNDRSLDQLLGSDCWNCGVSSPVTVPPTVTSSTANVGGETRPANVGVNYLIRY